MTDTKALLTDRARHVLRTQVDEFVLLEVEALERDLAKANERAESAERERDDCLLLREGDAEFLEEAQDKLFKAEKRAREDGEAYKITFEGQAKTIARLRAEIKRLKPKSLDFVPSHTVLFISESGSVFTGVACADLFNNDKASDPIVGWMEVPAPPETTEER